MWGKELVPNELTRVKKERKGMASWKSNSRNWCNEMIITGNLQPGVYFHSPNYVKGKPHSIALNKMVPQTLNAGSASLCLGLSDISITHYKKNRKCSPVCKFDTKRNIQNVHPFKLHTNGKWFTLFPMLITGLCYPSKREETKGKWSVNIWEYWRAGNKGRNK